MGRKKTVSRNWLVILGLALVLILLAASGGSADIAALPGKVAPAMAREDVAVMAIAGNTIQAASCSQTDVQAAIDAAGDGDFVLVPAGACTWTTPPGDDSVPAIHIDGKAITLQGAGIGQTIINDATGSGWNNSAIRVDGLNGKPFRITGFTFVGGSIAILGDCEAWRVDHCEFDNDGGVDNTINAVHTNGYTRGVVDHCLLKNSRIVVRDGGNGHDSWKHSLGLGTADAVYVEDNVYIRDVFGNSMDAGDGARYVFRYNQVTNSSCEAHSLQNAFADGTFARATRSYEIYHNYFTTLDNGKDSNWTAIHVRGGTGVIFGNRVVNASGAQYQIFGAVDNKRSMQTFPAPLGQCDGNNPLDGNTPPQETHGGYPCLDQIGRSTDYGSGDNRLPQALEPLYAWDNTFDGQPAAISVQHGPKVERHIQEGRDFFNNVPKPGYTPYVYPHPLTKDLALSGVPGDQTIRLNWTVRTILPVTTTWHIDYYTTTLTAPFTATNSLSTTRSTVLTENVENFQWYTVTLYAMLDELGWLSDTVRVMPTDIFVYLPLMMKED